MMIALNSLAAVQTKLTTEIKKQITKFLNYSKTYPDTLIEHRKIEIIFHIYSDISYISEP